MTKNLTVLTVIALLVACSSDIEKTRDGSKPVASDKLLAVKQRAVSVPSGIFSGSSKDQYGERAWLVCLDPANRKGKLYLPPDVLDLSLSDLNEPIVLQSQKGYGDLVYVLELNLTERLLVGTISTQRQVANTSKQLLKAEVSLEPVAFQDGWSELLQAPSGVYSNLKYVEEGGDLLGTELVLIRRSGGAAVGLITRFEGGPDGPYLLLDTNLRGDFLRFVIRTIHGKEVYSGVLSSSRLELKDETNPSLKKESLKRRSFSTIFQPNCHPKSGEKLER
ncbi:MAG: hypothetical protein DMG06_25275 [Acidobacteria bacterium]|nr:MAG: hypothetical protein DMG06_25275 [Acidobacteriota bacterium]